MKKLLGMKKIFGAMLLVFLLVTALTATGYAAPTSINLGDTITGKLTVTKTELSYSFTVPSNGQIELKYIYDVDKPVDRFWIRIFNTDNEEVWKNGNSYYTTPNQTSTYKINLKKGTYSIICKGYDNSTGNFTIRTSFLSGEESCQTDNSSFSNAYEITLGSEYNGFLALNQQIDYYKFTLEHSGTVSLKCIKNDKNPVEKLQLVLYTTDNEEIWTNSKNAFYAPTETSSYTIDLIPGTYILRMLGSTGEGGAYTLLTGYMDALETIVTDNGSQSNAVSIEPNKTYIGHLAINRSHDYFKFELENNENITLSHIKDEIHPVDRLILTLRNKDNEEIWKNVNGSEFYAPNESTSYKVSLSTGVYVLDVHGYDNGTGNYKLTIESKASQTPTTGDGTSDGGTSGGGTSEGGTSGGSVTPGTTSDSTYSDENGSYKISGSTCVYTSSANGAAIVKVPDVIKVNGKKIKVNAIADQAFSGNTTITVVTIGKNVKTIGKNAFKDCISLQTINGGKNVVTIKAYAFKNCTSLRKFTFYKKVKKIEKGAFQGCSNLKTLSFKTVLLTASSVGKNAFKGTHKKAVVNCPYEYFESYMEFLPSKGFGKKVKFR